MNWNFWGFLEVWPLYDFDFTFKAKQLMKIFLLRIYYWFKIRFRLKLIVGTWPCDIVLGLQKVNQIHHFGVHNDLRNMFNEIIKYSLTDYNYYHKNWKKCAILAFFQGLTLIWQWPWPSKIQFVFTTLCKYTTYVYYTRKIDIQLHLKQSYKLMYIKNQQFIRPP